jgi:hypothetical protein
MNRLYIRLSLALVVGAFITASLGYVVSSERSYHESRPTLCLSINALETTETAYGFPMTFKKTTSNTCLASETKWLPFNLIIDIVLYAIITYAILSVVRKRK